MTGTFIFYETFKRQLDELKNADQLRFYKAIAAYGIDGIEPDFSGMAKALWIQFKFAIDQTAARRAQKQESGKKGGRPQKSAESQTPPTAAEENADTDIPPAPECPTPTVDWDEIKNADGKESDIENTDNGDNEAENSGIYIEENSEVYGEKAGESSENQKKAEESTENLNKNVNRNVNVNKECPASAPPESENAAPDAEKSLQDFPPFSSTQTNNADGEGGNAGQSTVDGKTGKTNAARKTKSPITGEPLRLAELLRDLHQKIDAGYSPNPRHVETWAQDIEKLNRIDNRDYAEIERVIRWVKTDGNFWFSNIESGGKLRAQYSRLLIQMTNEHRKKPQQNKTGGAWAGDQVNADDLARYERIFQGDNA
ncbi:MAG: DUF6291 domain-containing protein [Treponema sp.]